MIAKVVAGTFKSGKEWGKVTFEDESGSFEWELYGNDYLPFKNYFAVKKLLYCKGKTSSYFKKDTREEVTKFVPIEFFPLDEIYDKLCKEVLLSINITDVSTSVAYSIKEAIEKSPGTTTLVFKILEENEHFHTEMGNVKYKICPETFIDNLKLLIDYKIELK